MYHRYYPPDGSCSKNSRHRWLCKEVINGNADQSRHVCNVTKTSVIFDDVGDTAQRIFGYFRVSMN